MRVVESPIIPDNDKEPQPLSFLRCDWPLMKCIQECHEALCVVWANSGDMESDNLIGDGSTHGYVGTPLSWNCESSPVPNEVPSTSPHFAEIEDMMCPRSFKQNYNERGSS